MGKGQATKKPEEKRLEKRKRKEVYRQVHQQAVYIAPIFGLIAVIVVGMVFWATRPTPAAA